MHKPDITIPAVVYCVLSPSMIPMVDCGLLVIVAYSFSYESSNSNNTVLGHDPM